MTFSMVVAAMLVLVSLVSAVAATSDHHVQAFKFWEQMLPAVTMPFSVRTSVSPVEGTVAADPFATQIRQGLIFPSAAVSFCKAAELCCQENIVIAPYEMAESSTLRKIAAPRALGIKTINDFQMDFFLESSLAEGSTITLDQNLHDPIPKRAFLPRIVADTLPALTTANLPRLLQTFNIRKRTNMGKIMGPAAYLCGNPALPGEVRACPTSVEAMAEFVSSQVGNNVEVLATTGAPAEAPEVKAPVKVLDYTKRSLGEGKNIVICHNLMFPSQLYYCHHVTTTKVIQASLATTDGSVIHAVAICHLDTSMWASEHPAFAALNIPQGEEACHWSGQNDLVWVPIQEDHVSGN